MNRLSHPPSITKRWLIFNAVGAMGFVVQIIVLWLLVSGFEIGYLLATGLAVEAAIVHNFIWHEHWTWADRVKGRCGGVVRRLLYFHTANGLISLALNLALMQLFVGKLGIHYIPANLISVTVCAILNFLAGNHFVYRNAPAQRIKGGSEMNTKTFRIAAAALAMTSASLILASDPVRAAELKPNTIKAWKAAVEETERRISTELSSTKKFLSLDFQDPQEAAGEKQEILSGTIPIRQVSSGKDIKVPKGMIHHWRGSVFIPGIPLEFILSRLKNPDLEDTRQEDVLDSRVLERTPDMLKLYLKLQRSKVVTAVYNTEHLVRYKNHGPGKESSSSVATKIAEIEYISDNRERERPQGNDRGFLWRMNSYWRYQEVEGGVIVECESMTLSRSVPFLLEYALSPVIKNTARESLNRTLESMRTRMVRAYESSPQSIEPRTHYFATQNAE